MLLLRAFYHFSRTLIDRRQLSFLILMLAYAWQWGTAWVFIMAGAYLVGIVLGFVILLAWEIVGVIREAAEYHGSYRTALTYPLRRGN
jgi:hypothetical protein